MSAFLAPENPTIPAEFSSNDLLHIEADVSGIADEQLALIEAKIRQALAS